MKLELVRYDTGLAIYLDDEQVAGVEPIGCGKLLVHYDFTESELEKIRGEINYFFRITDNDE